MTAHRALRAGLPRSGPAYVVPSTSLLTGALLVMATLAVGCGPGGGEAPPEPVAFKADRTELRRVTLPENAGLTAAQVDALKNAPGKITFTAPYDGEPTSKTTNPEGLIIEVFAEGEGDEAKEGSEVAVHYTGWMENGFEFDSSFRSPSSKVRRGCCGLRCTRSIGSERGPSVLAAVCGRAAATGATTGAGVGAGACAGCCGCALVTGSSNTLRGGSTGAGRVSFVAGQAGAFAGVGVSVRTGSPSNAESPRPRPRGLKSLIALVSVRTDPIRFRG